MVRTRMMNEKFKQNFDPKLERENHMRDLGTDGGY
jgi:hypothetical protein